MGKTEGRKRLTHGISVSKWRPIWRINCIDLFTQLFRRNCCLARIKDTLIIVLFTLNQGQSVSKGAVFKISNAERSEAESGEAEGRSASPWGHYLTGLVLGPPNCITCPITFVACDTQLVKKIQRLFLSQTYRKHFHGSFFNENFGASRNEIDLPLSAQLFLVTGLTFSDKCRLKPN